MLLPSKLFQWLSVVVSTTLSCLAHAQPTGLLYDPEPPVDSAYVRVLVAPPGATMDVAIDGKIRFKQLSSGSPSDYLVVPAGSHVVSIQPSGQSKVQHSAALDVVRGRAMTVAFASLQAGVKPFIFEDKANSNKLKALVAVYHLDAKVGALDVLSADGKTKVFSTVQFGQSAHIQVNPITIDLMVARSGAKTALATTPLSMTQGGTFSIVLTSGAGGKLIARSYQNKIERYTGK